MLSRTALLVLGLVAAAMAQSTFTVVSAPSSVGFDASAGSVPLCNVGKALSASLGLNADLAWPGVVATSPFGTPQASVVVVMDAAAGIPTGIAQFPIAHSESSFESLASHLASTHAAAFAPVLAKVFSAASNVLTVSASQDIAAVSQGHSLHWDAASMSFEDSAHAFSLTEAEIENLFSSLSLQGVTFDKVSATFSVAVGGNQHVELSAQDFSAFFREIYAMLEIASRFAASSKASNSPASLALTLSTLPSALASASSSEQAALKRVAASFLAALTLHMNSAFANQVVVSAVTLNGASEVDSAHIRVARETSLDVNPQIAGKYKPHQPAFVEYCAKYRCFCRADAAGTPFNLASGCTNCTTEPCPCVTYGCDCDSASVIDVSSRCKQCAPGYVLHGNSCYVDNGWVVQFNMVLFLGLLAVLSLIATCYALGNMDPGRNSIIYRMTSGRMKAQ